MAQPPIQPFQRKREAHDFWPGFIVALIGAIVIVRGVAQVTNLDTLEGNSATELQLVKAFSSGGLVFTDLTIPPRIDDTMDPAAVAAAMQSWERTAGKAAGKRWKIRVNTGASTPCPT